jgi:hypothetical protein
MGEVTCECGRKFRTRGRTPTRRPQCPTCRQRASRERRRSEVENADAHKPAYLTDALGLSEAEKWSVANILRTPVKNTDGVQVDVLGPPKLRALLRCIERNGQVGGILESAWALPLAEYRQIEAAWRAAEPPGRSKLRRSRDRF